MPDKCLLPNNPQTRLSQTAGGMNHLACLWHFAIELYTEVGRQTCYNVPCCIVEMVALIRTYYGCLPYSITSLYGFEEFCYNYYSCSRAQSML